MKLLHDLWHDESGSIISAELVLLGTLGVVGVGVGAAAVGHSVEAELDEVALSLRSANQSYHWNGFQGCGAWTAGSGFRQQPVRKSRAMASKPRTKISEAPSVGRKTPITKISKTIAGARRGGLASAGGAPKAPDERRRSHISIDVTTRVRKDKAVKRPSN